MKTQPYAGCLLEASSLNWGLWHFCNAFKSILAIFSLSLFSRSVNALIAFLPPQLALKRRRWMTLHPKEDTALWNRRRSMSSFPKFVMTNLMRCVRSLQSMHMYSKRPLGSQITINFHRSWYEQLHKWTTLRSFPLFNCVCHLLYHVCANPYRFICSMFTIHQGKWNHIFLPCVALHFVFSSRRYRSETGSKTPWNTKIEKETRKYQPSSVNKKCVIAHGRAAHTHSYSRILFIDRFILFVLRGIFT